MYKNERTHFMLALTTTKKSALRAVIVILAVLVGVGIAIIAFMSAMTASAATKRLPIYSVSRDDGKIALTFDCAWGNSNTDELLAILKTADAKATFFVTGEFCDKYPEDVKKLYDAGHEIANHSDVHPHVQGMNINELIEDTRECSRKIKMITGCEPTLYRAPYGEYDDNAIATIEGMNLYFIQWSVDSIDWKEPSAETIRERILEKAVSGSILLFHNDLENTTAALPEILTELKNKNMTFSTVSDMIYTADFHIDNTGLQISDLPAIAYTNDYLVNEALEIMRQNLTLEEIYRLTQGADVALINRITPLLNAAQIAAIQSMSYEDLKEAIWSLVAVAESEGAGGDASIAESPEDTTTADETTTDPEMTTAPETTTVPETTTIPVTTDMK